MHAGVEAILHAGDETLLKEPGFVYGGGIVSCGAQLFRQMTFAASA